MGLKAGMDKPAWGKVIRVLTVRLSATLKVSLIVQCTIDVLVSRDQHVARGRNLSPVWQHLIVGDGRTQQLGISCIFLESRGVLATTRLFICLESRGMLATTRLEGSWSSHYPCSSKKQQQGLCSLIQMAGQHHLPAPNGAESRRQHHKFGP